MRINTTAFAVTALGLALTAITPQTASANNGASDITRTGCQYSSYPRLTHYVNGQWANQLWDSVSCRQSWVSLTLNNNASASWQIGVYMMRYTASSWITTGGNRTYAWNGPGHYFSYMEDWETAYLPCGEVQFSRWNSVTNCQIKIIVK
jgi:hypothetical protein